MKQKKATADDVVLKIGKTRINQGGGQTEIL